MCKAVGVERGSYCMRKGSVSKGKVSEKMVRGRAVLQARGMHEGSYVRRGQYESTQYE